MSDDRRRKTPTTVYLEIEQKKLLTEVSKEFRVTEAAIIRVAIREALEWRKNLKPKFIKESDMCYRDKTEMKRQAIERLKQKIKILEAIK